MQKEANGCGTGWKNCEKVRYGNIINGKVVPVSSRRFCAIINVIVFTSLRCAVSSHLVASAPLFLFSRVICRCTEIIK